MADFPKIHPLGLGALTVDLGNEIAKALNTQAISLASHLAQNSFPGFIEAVPAYSSVSVFFNVIEVRRSFPEFDSAFEAVRDLVRPAVQTSRETPETPARLIEIPVDFSDSAALDIKVVEEYSGLSRPDVIDRFTSKEYRVYMLGFLPGFAYMGEVDARIAVPRKHSPRTRVPKGSVGIASGQTGIYPFESPGGWQIIGQTNLEMFAPNSDSPCTLKPGDSVRFVELG